MGRGSWADCSGKISGCSPRALSPPPPQRQGAFSLGILITKCRQKFLQCAVSSRKRVEYEYVNEGWKKQSPALGSQQQRLNPDRFQSLLYYV